MKHSITLQTAVAMTTLYRQENENILETAYKGMNILPTCETFERLIFDSVLQETDCTGLRIYYGMTEDLNIHAIIVGVNRDNEDILPSNETLTTTTIEDGDNLIIEEGIRCPDFCPPPSPLNG